jgi:hypothetical protein
MPTIEISRAFTHMARSLAAYNNCSDTRRSGLMDRSPLADLSPDAAGMHAPQLVHFRIHGPSGFSAHGVLKSASRGGLQVLTPISVPPRCAVQVAIARCRAFPGEVFHCVKKSGVYQVGIVFSSRYKTEIALGKLAIITTLEAPFTVSRGNVLDAGASSLSILCKTMLAPGAWVRVESNGWILFGEVDAVVSMSMVACCAGVHLDAAFSGCPTTHPPVHQYLERP